MRPLIMIAVLLSLIPLTVLGHDLYMAYGQDDEIDLGKPFHLSYVGWLWETYAPDSFRSFRANIDPETWAKWIRPVMEQSALLVSVIPPAILFATALLVKLGAKLVFMIRMHGAGPNKAAARPAVALKKENVRLKYKRK